MDWKESLTDGRADPAEMKREYDPATPLIDIDDQHRLDFGHLRNANRARARLNSYKRSKRTTSTSSANSEGRSEDEMYDPLHPLTSEDEDDERGKLYHFVKQDYTPQTNDNDEEDACKIIDSERPSLETSGCRISYHTGHNKAGIRGSSGTVNVVVLSDDDDDEIQILSVTEKTGRTWNNNTSIPKGNGNCSSSGPMLPDKMAQPQIQQAWVPTYTSSVAASSAHEEEDSASTSCTPNSPNESLLERVAEILYSSPAVIAQKHITLDKICCQDLIKLPESEPASQPEINKSVPNDCSISSFEPEPGQSMIHIFRSQLPILKQTVPAYPKIGQMTPTLQEQGVKAKPNHHQDDQVHAGPSDKSDLEAVAQHKHLERLVIQGRAEDEVKHALKPHYLQRTIDKAAYKDILGRSVRKICNSSSGIIDPTRVAQLVDAYVKKFKLSRNEKTANGING